MSRATASSEAPAAMEARTAELFLALVPGLLVVYFGFNAGGFFPGAVGLATLVVIQLLVLRVLLAQDPFEGLGRPATLVAGRFVALAAWTLASALWSNAQGRALIEFDRALLYVLLFALFATVPRSRWRIPIIVRGLALGLFVVCAAGLVTRLRPDILSTSRGLALNRLSYPVTYWNALGILATLGVILLLGLASRRQEPLVVRILAATAVPVLAVTLFFTFSRGAMLALAVGLVVFALAFRGRSLLIALLATAPPTAVALKVAYDADLLATTQLTTPAAMAQGRHVATVLVACMVGAGLAIAALRMLERAPPPLRLSRRSKAAIGVSGACALTVVFLVAGGPSWLSKEYERFLYGAPTHSADLRDRLTDPSSNGRTDHWRVALRAFADDPLKGHGAGTFQYQWERRRAADSVVVDAHSLWLETPAELGVVGLLLLVAGVVAILVAVAVRARGPDAALYAALFAAGVAWAFHVAGEWDWEMPVTTAWLFAVGGAVLARDAGGRPPAPASNATRLALALGLLVAAVTPALLMLAQRPLAEAASAFRAGNCQTASSRALASIEVLSVRPEPYQILGYCDMEAGRPRDAVAALTKAVAQEPASWEYRYGLALAQALAGRDPRAEISRALQLNPREGLLRTAAAGFKSAPAGRWERVATKAREAAVSSGRLTLR